MTGTDGDEVRDEDEEELAPVRPPRQATPAQAMLAIVLLCAFCIAIGFVLGRTL